MGLKKLEVKVLSYFQEVERIKNFSKTPAGGWF
jgi:hypothetical protein